MAAVNYFSQSTPFKPSNPRTLSAWIRKVINQEDHKLKQLNFIFCSDEYLLDMNMEYLNHKTYTDVITFDNSEEEGRIEGDVFISIDRVKDNAEKLGVEFKDELDRVIVHGVLHLLGYSDKSVREKKEMRKKEDAYLSLR